MTSKLDEWRTRCVVLLKNSRESRKGTRRRYNIITLGEIFAAIDQPTAFEKEYAQAILPSSYASSDAREFAMQRERGSFEILAADIDKGNVPLERIKAAVGAAFGSHVASAIYSTSSATIDNNKWRVLAPLAVSVPYDTWALAQRGFFDILRAHGIVPDTALERSGQLIYLPNVPPDGRGKDGEPNHYQISLAEGSPVDLSCQPLAGAIQRLAEAARAAEAQRAKDRAARMLKKALRPAMGLHSPIERFNAENPLEYLLEKYGYEQKHAGSCDWRSPLQTSSSFATRVELEPDGGRWSSLSGSDADAKLGAPTDSGYRFGDAFDLFVHFEHKGDRKAALAAIGCNARSSGSNSFRFIRVGDLEYKPPEFLVDGLIETETLGQIFGDPGAGKSFVGVDLALSVATGAPFHGRAVRQGPVFLIAGEGHNGLTRRFSAWSLHNGVSIENASLFMSNRPAQFLDADSAAGVTDAVRELAAQHGKPALIEIDTLARNYGPGDENSTSDMSAFIAAVDDLKAEFPGCAIALIHHTGHAEKKRGRGAMALKGALDWEYLVEKADDIIRLTNTKMKDAEPPAPLAFTLETVNLRDGASSAALLVTDAPRPTRRLSPTLQLAVDALVEAARGSTNGVHLDQWQRVFLSRHTGDNEASKSRAFRRARADLVALSALSATDDLYKIEWPEIATAVSGADK
jgi:hypothetical protein